MKRRSLFLTGICLVLVIVTSLMAACSGTAPASAPTSAFKWPASLILQSNSAEGIAQIVSSAWAPKMEKMTGINIRLTIEQSESLRAINVKTNKVNMTMHTMTGINLTTNAQEAYSTRDGGPYQTRIVWLQDLREWGIFVRGDSSIKTINDVKAGTKWSVYAGAEPRQSAFSVAAWRGLSEQDFELIVGANPRASLNNVMDGRANAVSYPASSPSLIEAASLPNGIRSIEMDPAKDPAGAERFAKYRPLTSFSKASNLVVPQARGQVLAVDPAWYCTTEENMSTDLVYNVVKWLHENYDSYKDVHEMASNLNLQFVRGLLDTTAVPIHSGVIKFLKEKGMWTAADDKRQAYNIDLIKKYQDAHKKAIADADAKKIDVNPDNNDWINLWNQYRKDLPVLKIMYNIP